MNRYLIILVAILCVWSIGFYALYKGYFNEGLLISLFSAIVTLALGKKIYDLRKSNNNYAER